MNRYLLPQHWPLITQITKRDVLSRFKGSWFGSFWLVITPLLSLLIYTLAFRYIFQVKWGEQLDHPLQFALNLFAGLIIFRWFSAVIARAPRLLLEHTYLITKIVFPIEILAWSLVISESIQALIGLLLLMFLSIVTGGQVTWAHLSIPIIFCTLIPWLLAGIWLLSSLGVYLRDLPQIIDPALGLLIFLTPVFYPSGAVPSFLQAWLWLNPLTLPIDSLRAVLFEQNYPNYASLALSFGIGSIFALLSARIFHHLRPGFADVI